MQASELVELLREERDIFTKLTDVLFQERKSIISFDSEGVTSCHREKTALAEKLGELEDKRAGLTGGRDFAEMAAELSPGEREALFLLREELKVKIREARALQKANTVLFKQCLSFTEQLFRELSSQDTQGYSETGKLAERSLKGNFISSSA